MEAKVDDKEIFEQYIASKPWLKIYDPDVPHEIDIPEIPLYKILDDTYSRYADHTAFIFLGRQVSYKEFFEASERFGRALVDKFNVKKGEVIAIYLPNCPQFAIAYYGIIKVGGVVTPVNPLYTARELTHQINDSNASILIALDLFKDNVEEAVKNTNLKAVIYTGVEDYLPGIKAFLYKAFKKKVKVSTDGEFYYSFKTLLATHEPNAPRPEINPKDDVAALMYTGGTTGVPKGAMITHYNFISNIYQIDAWYMRGTKGRERYIGLLPWYHSYGQTAVLHAAIFRAATIIILPKFDMKELLTSIQKYKADIFHGVPTIYSLLINYPDVKKYDLTSIAACISGAGALPVAVAERFESITGGKIREGYGLTETTPVTHVNPIFGKNKFGSIGVPVPNTLAAIADTEKPIFLKPGEIGELVISGPQVMKGYYNMPEENKAVFFEKYGYRWFRTGDIAYMDEEGYFYIVERKKDMIKYKGHSVYPREIEEVLYKHEAVAEAAVIGIPDPETGERIKAFIVLKDEYKGKVSAEDILKYLKNNLAPYKVPKEIEFRDSLPKSTVGKILKRVLREEEIKKRGIK